jgi:hypothetical protein
MHIVERDELRVLVEHLNGRKPDVEPIAPRR